ncbi:hypothetical protein EI94DRAFT_189014 [Lactarius quietus]|nr:hypothetical protein EI94DRAFT_189014 [Lactarius quietus]
MHQLLKITLLVMLTTGSRPNQTARIRQCVEERHAFAIDKYTLAEFQIETRELEAKGPGDLRPSQWSLGPGRRQRGRSHRHHRRTQCLVGWGLIANSEPNPKWLEHIMPTEG